MLLTGANKVVGAVALASVVVASAVLYISRENAGVSPVVEASVALSPADNQQTDAQMPAKKVKVEKLEIDLTGKRAFIPAEGWVSARAFWQIYFDQPEKLPGEIDFELLQQFEKVTDLQRKQALGLAPETIHQEDKIAAMAKTAPAQPVEVIPQDPAAQQ